MTLAQGLDNLLGITNIYESTAIKVFNRIQSNSAEKILFENNSWSDVEAIIRAYSGLSDIFVAADSFSFTNDEGTTDANITEHIQGQVGYTQNQVYFTLYELFYLANDGDTNAKQILTHKQDSDILSWLMNNFSTIIIVLAIFITLYFILAFTKVMKE